MQLDPSTPVSISNILLATDFSPSSQTALHYTLAIARRLKGRLYLVHVVQPSTYEMLSEEMQRRALDDAWREAQRSMTDLLIEGHLQGVEHQLLVEKGEIWEVLSGLIDRLKIDLLVTGTRGRTRLAKLFLGSVAETIFRQATIPVMTVGPKVERVPEGGPQRILFCTGFSNHSLSAGNVALALAQRQQAQLLVLTVITDPVTVDQRKQVEEDTRQRLRNLIPPQAVLANDPQLLVEFGDAADRILAVATEHKPDLIVLGIRQPTKFALRLRWATAYQVVTAASCPVLTVRSPETA